MVIRAKKFILRPLRKADAPAISKHANDKDVYRNTLLIPRPYTLKDANEWILKNLARYKKKNKTDFVFAIEIDGEVGGAVGIHNIIEGHKAELGYWLARKYWGNGIMTQAAKLAMEYAFEKFNLKRVYAFSFSWNKASMRVMQKAGMKFEGVKKKNSLKDGKYIDDYIYAKIK